MENQKLAVYKFAVPSELKAARILAKSVQGFEGVQQKARLLGAKDMSFEIKMADNLEFVVVHDLFYFEKRPICVPEVKILSRK